MQKEDKKKELISFYEEQDTGSISTSVRRIKAHQQRRGLLRTFDEDGSIEFARKHSWLAQIAQRSGVRGKLLYQTQVSDEFNCVTCVKFAPDGENFVVGYGSGAVQVRQGTTGNVVRDVAEPSVLGLPVNCVRFLRPSADFFTCSSKGTINLWRARGEYKTYCTEPDNEINSIDLNSINDVLISGGRDGVVRVYDVNTAKDIHNYGKPTGLNNNNDNFHKMRIFCTKFYNVGKDIFITGGWDDLVKVWDLRVKTGCVKNIIGPHICGDALDTRGETILTGSWTLDNSLQLWDLHSGNLIETINPVNRPRTVDGEFLYCVQFYNGDPTGNSVLTGGSGTGALEVVGLQERKITTSFKIHRAIQTIDSNKKCAVFGGADNVIRVANISV